MSLLTYATLSVVIDGVVDEENDYFDQTLLDNRLRNLAEESQAHGYYTEVYVMYHDHDSSVVPCECVLDPPLAEYNEWTEFLTDHELLERILPLLPDATLGEDREGQWIIYTNCGPRRNAGCDKCGTYDRADGSTFCLSCENEEYERLIRTDTTECPYCAYDGDAVITHNPVAHAENGDPDTREEEA